MGKEAWTGKRGWKMGVVDRKAVVPLSQRHTTVCCQPPQPTAVAVASIVKNPPLVGDTVNHNS
jgi:hypothetical protein